MNLTFCQNPRIFGRNLTIFGRPRQTNSCAERPPQAGEHAEGPRVAQHGTDDQPRPEPPRLVALAEDAGVDPREYGDHEVIRRGEPRVAEEEVRRQLRKEPRLNGEHVHDA